MLHLYQQGLYKYALESFIDGFTSEQKRALDQLIANVSQSCCRQSDRSFPRFRFPRGITNLSCFTAAEQVGITVLCFICIGMASFEKVCLKFNPSTQSYMTDTSKLQQCKAFCVLFESMLITEAWINQDTHSRNELSTVAENKLTQFMVLYKKTVNRTTGNGLKIPKFHQLKHLPRYALKFGSPNNFSTSRCESHHIDLSKKPAATAQKRDDCFEQQVGKRIVDNIVMKRATQALESQFNQLSISSSKRKHVGTRFSIVRLQQDDGFEAIPCSGTNSSLPFDKNLLNTFAAGFSSFFPPNDGIPCFTEHHRYDEIASQWYVFRAHPFYKGKPWNDWALFRWSNDNDEDEDSNDLIDIPAKILFFVDLSAVHDHPEYEPGHYAVVQSFTSVSTSISGYSIVRQGNVNPRTLFHLCHVDSIVDVLFVVPNSGSTNHFFVVSPPSTWSNSFTT